MNLYNKNLIDLIFKIALIIVISILNHYYKKKVYIKKNTS